MNKQIILFYVSALISTSLIPVISTTQVNAENPQTPVQQADMYRMYNPNSGEHFYTSNFNERDNLARLGWNYEGIGWTAPVQSSLPVYRLYNPNAGDHHYTLNVHEKDILVSLGWRDEGIGWYSDEANTIPIYRQYNPNAIAGAHNFTSNLQENNHLRDVGWREEGISWYAQNDLNPAPEHPITVYKTIDYSSVYDFYYYQANNPDVRRAFGNNDIATLQHFIVYGMNEKRQAKAGVDPNSTFNSILNLRTASSRARNILNSTGGRGIFSLNGFAVPGDVTAAVQNGINQVGAECAFVMIDLRTGRGLGYNIDASFYSASSVKGPYMATITRYAGADSAHQDMVQRVLWYSDNNDYASLFRMYGSSYMQRWYNESGVPGYRGSLYVNYSARDLSRLWVTMFDYFQNDGHGSSFSNLYTRPNISPIHSNLGGRYTTKTKAGWISEGPGYTVINDSGIVYAGNHPYIMTVLTKVGGYQYNRLDALINALNNAHSRIIG